jgi:Hsp70 protein
VLIAASREAGLLPAGVDPILIPEPVAAATHFATLSGGGLAQGRALAVYDLGAGTFDVAVVRREGNGYDVLAEAGLPDLGGIDFDHAIVDHIGRTHAVGVDAVEWRRILQPEDSATRRLQRALMTDVRDAKEALSRYPHTDIALPPPFTDLHLTRTEFEQLVRPSLSRSIDLLRQTIGSAALSASDLAGIYLVGGSSRVPLVARLIQEGLGVTPTTLDQPETSVATGALYLPVGGSDRAATGPLASQSGLHPARLSGPPSGWSPQGPTQQGQTQRGPGGPPSGPVRATPAGRFDPAGSQPVGGGQGGQNGQGGQGTGAGPTDGDTRRKRALLAGGVLVVVAALVVTLVLVLGDGGGNKAGGGSSTSTSASTSTTASTTTSTGTSASTSAGSSPDPSGTQSNAQLDKAFSDTTLRDYVRPTYSGIKNCAAGGGGISVVTLPGLTLVACNYKNGTGVVFARTTKDQLATFYGLFQEAASQAQMQRTNEVKFPHGMLTLYSSNGDADGNGDLVWENPSIEVVALADGMGKLNVTQLEDWWRPIFGK